MSFLSLMYLKVKLKLPSFNKRIEYKNSPSDGCYFFDVILDLNISNNHKIIDAGCVTGSIINTLKKFLFSEIC